MMTDPTGQITRRIDVDDYGYPPEYQEGYRENEAVDLRSMLKEQLKLTSKLQAKLSVGIEALPPREVKELIGSISSILTLAHRTEEILTELDTYKLFMDATVKFLKTRQDSLGEDLVGELRQVAATMRTRRGEAGLTF